MEGRLGDLTADTRGSTPTPGSAAVGEAVLVTAVKNEAPFLLEWIAYHKVIGFSRIVILSNSSVDGTEDILSALAAKGEIVHYHVDPGLDQSPQGAALKVFEEREGYRDGNWYMWLDADEFLNIHVGARRLDDLIAALGDHHGIHLNWRIFGTSGHQRFPGRFVSADFAGTSSLRLGANRETKSIFRKGPDIIGFGANGVYRPRLDPQHKLTAADFLAGNGMPLVAGQEVTMKWLAGDKFQRTNIASLKETGWALAQVNHYMVRTPEFFRLKALRGRGAGKLRLRQNSRHTPEFFRRFDLNGAKDVSIVVWEAEVGEKMAQLSQHPEVALAAARSDALMAEILSSVDTEALATLSPKNTAPLAAPVPTVPGGRRPRRGRRQAATSSAEKVRQDMSDIELTAADDGVQNAAPAAQPSGNFKLTFPPAVGRLVTELYQSAQSILEYGSGGSTVLAAKAGKPVISVESDKGWADRMAETLAGISTVAKVHHVDIGQTKDWGRPRNTEGFARYHTYALSVWDRPDLGDPDLVLIDGRFRAACLAAVVMRARQPTTVLFDDYVDRTYYHAVEKLAEKEQVVGRMARFTVTPGPIPPEMLTQVIGWFSDPR
jgi:hypothetical protein